MKVTLADIKNFAEGNINYYLEKAGVELDSELKVEVEKRIEICSKCPFLGQEEDGPFCTSCGCPFPKLTYAPSKSCPKGFWEKINKDV